MDNIFPLLGIKTIKIFYKIKQERKHPTIMVKQASQVMNSSNSGVFPVFIGDKSWTLIPLKK